MHMPKPFGWLGNYDGFHVVQSCMVKPSKPPVAHNTVLAPADMVLRCKLYWSPTFCLLVPDRLVFGTLVRSVAELITLCPVIAGRLDLTPPASIRHDNECSGITVSEAEWLNCSRKNFEECAHCYATPPPMASADDGFLPAPPYEDPVESKEGCSGSSPLFKMRLTHLGDGSSVLAASWSHALTDGSRATEILNALAALYRGQCPESLSSMIAPSERHFWPKHLKPYLEAANQGVDSSSFSDAGPDSQEDLQAPSPYAIGRHGCARVAMLTHLYQGYTGEPHLSFTVHVTQADLLRLKARLVGHPALAPLPFFSTNDVTTALAWLLACDARDRARPGQKARGEQSKGFVLVEFSKRGLPRGLVPAGYIGNLTESVMLTCTSDGTMKEDPNTANNLMDSLAVTVCSVRTGILKTLEPNWGLQALASGITHQKAESFQKLVEAVHAVDHDVRLTNWNTFNNQFDFGSGKKADMTGHLRMAGGNLCCVVRRLDGNGVGLRFESTWAGYERVLASPILPCLSSSSGVPQQLQDALQAHAIR